MDFKTLTHHSHLPFQNPNNSKRLILTHSSLIKQSSIRISSNSSRYLSIKFTKTRRIRLVSACTGGTGGDEELRNEFEMVEKGGFATDECIWSQMVEILKFSGPATGIWLTGPLMSLIDTVVVGQSSSIELAALGPGTVFCDDLGYLFMFLSIATSNLVATALAGKDKDEVQHQISILLSIGLSCGVLMFLFTRLLGPWTLTAFTGAKNVEIVSAANTYIQIRGLAWPALLIGWIAQSASLGMKDSWGPLKALAVASTINVIGDVVLCTFLGYGIAGAAWATMASQVVAGYMMVDALNKKGYNGFALAVPSSSELRHIFTIAAPVFITLMSKVVFYSLLVYSATAMGIQTVAAHQVMIQMYFICAVWAEPLAQTAQSFMPELIYGANQNLAKARMLLKSLIIIGILSGIILGSVGTCVPWLFPQLFSPDAAIIKEMHKVLVPYFITLIITPSTSGTEGALLAVRELKFISLSMSGIVSIGALLLLFLTSRGHGLPVCWWALAAFQWSRFIVALTRLSLPDGILNSDNLTYDKEHIVGF